MEQNKQKTNELSLEQQEKLERLKIHFTSLHSLLVARNGLLPVIASLSAVAITIIVALEPEILSITIKELKIIITILFVIIILPLVFHFFEINPAIKNHLTSIKEITKKDFFTSKSSFGKLLAYIMSYLPLVLILIISLVLLYIIYTIWR